MGEESFDAKVSAFQQADQEYKELTEEYERLKARRDVARQHAAMCETEMRKAFFQEGGVEIRIDSRTSNPDQDPRRIVKKIALRDGRIQTVLYEVYEKDNSRTADLIAFENDLSSCLKVLEQDGVLDEDETTVLCGYNRYFERIHGTWTEMELDLN